MRHEPSSATSKFPFSLPRLMTILRILTIPILLSAVSIVDAENISSFAKGRNVDTRIATDFSNETAQTFHVAIIFNIQPSWHIYWKNPGTTGIPTTVKWKLPEGLSEGMSYYSFPHRYDNEGLIDYIHEDSAAIVTEIAIDDPEILTSGSLTIAANVDWLECENICVPGGSQLAIVIDPKDPRTDQETVSLIRKTLSRYDDPLHGQFVADDQQIEVYFPGDFDRESGINSTYFFSENPINDPAAAQQLTLTADGILLTTIPSDYGETIHDRHFGFLQIDYKNGRSLRKRAVLDRVDTIAASPVAQEPESKSGFLPILLLAFLGGLILNLMPCVFPVIGLKIMGFVEQAGQDRKKIISHGLVFALGVMVSFWILSGLLLLLRSGGEQLGWGFQLQEPWFNYILILLLLIFALSLSGVFEFGISAIGIGNDLTRKSGLSGSFFSGVLATIVATPCSAPFLAPALGAALALKPTESLVVFTVIALGLSTPYLLLSVFPGILNRLPRPGAWMETFKQFMAFPLYGTVAYLIWTLMGQIDDSNQLSLLLSIALLAMALWIFGRWGTPSKSRKTRTIAVVVTLLLMAVSVYSGYPRPKKHFWEPWSPELVQKYVSEGRTVYVDFTARWCATCQLNKRVVFSSEAVKESFKNHKVIALKADWTNRDERITRRLQELGKAAVPVNLVYKNGENEPIILPELLTPEIVLDALER